MTEATQMSTTPTAAMLVIGDEILAGRTRDSNAHHLAGVMTEIGVALREVRMIPDEKELIISSLRALSQAHTHVFTSGGIGPTHDDITADAVAEAFGVEIDVRADARAILEAYYGGDGINAARMRMARIPDGAALIDNPVSRAPGFSLGNVHVMAGVPIIFQEMLASLRPSLAGGPPFQAWSFRAAIPEGEIAAALTDLDAAHPAVTFGSYPFFRGGLGTTVVARSADAEALTAAAAATRRVLAEFGVEVAETGPAGD